MQTFKDLNIKDATKKAIMELNMNELTSIQELVIPVMIEGKDLIVQAQTGTGKTFAFAIPIIEKVIEDGGTQSLVLCPTRELALQVYGEFLKLLKFYPKINISPIVGGESYERQFKSLNRNSEIIVGTPGRIIDHLNRKTINLNKLTMITFDEADEMLKMGFKEEIETILSNVSSEIQTTLFSATIPSEIKSIAKKYQKNAVTVKVESETLTVSKITQNYYIVKKQDKLNLLMRLIDLENAKSTIIFANTKKEVDEITEFLNDHNYNANSLHGDLKQKDRNIVTNSFRKGLLNILVATDVAARGLDIKGVELIINYEIPYEMEIYVHRIGRTGRAGLSGKAYSILTPRTEYKIRSLEKFINQEIKKMEVPNAKAINKFLTNEFIKDYASKALGFDKEYRKVIREFENLGVEKDQLLNLLLSDLLPQNKEYEEIEIIKDKPKVEKSKTKQQEKSPLTQKGFITFKIDLGRVDKASPIVILDILESKFNIRGNNVGDIKHFQTYTTFNISLKASRQMKNLGFNYKGKKVNISLFRN